MWPGIVRPAAELVDFWALITNPNVRVQFPHVVTAGITTAAFFVLGLYLVLREQFEQKRWYLWALLFAIALPYIANTTGWLLTEIARQRRGACCWAGRSCEHTLRSTYGEW